MFLRNPNNNFQIRKPFFCCIVLTDKCFLRCKMCSLWKNEVSFSEELPQVDDWKKFLISLREFVQSPIEINLSGGEPFSEFYKLLELVKFSNQLGFITSVSSNGYLIDKVMAERIKEAGLKRLVLSLDSLDGKKHDYLRGREGCFRRVTEAIENLRSVDQNIEIGIQTIIMGMNIEEVIPLVYWTEKNDNLRFIHFQAVIQPIGDPVLDKNWHKQKTFEELWPEDLVKAHRVLDQLINLRESGNHNPYKIANPSSQLRMYKTYFKNPNKFIRRRRICNTIDFAINVNKLGSVYLCMFMQPIGNIREPVIDIWHSEKTNEIRKKIALCKNNCNFLLNCNYED